MYERFTGRARKVAGLAHDRSIESPDAGDVLLALLDEGTGVAVEIFKRLQIDPNTLRDRLESLREANSRQESLTATSTETFNRIVEHGLREAHDLRHNYIGTEHLLLGIVGLENNPVGRLLQETGVTRTTIIDELDRLLGPPSQEQPGPSAAHRIGRSVRNVIQRIASLW